MYFTTPSNLILTQKVDDLDKNKLLLEKIGHINCFIFSNEVTLILCHIASLPFRFLICRLFYSKNKKEKKKVMPI
jgi:hypothetical protein